MEDRIVIKKLRRPDTWAVTAPVQGRSTHLSLKVRAKNRAIALKLFREVAASKGYVIPA